MEGNDFVKTGVLKKFSEQQLVECDTGGYGCGGGLPIQVFEGYAMNNVMYTEASWPYLQINSGVVSETCDPDAHEAGKTTYKTIGGVSLGKTTTIVSEMKEAITNQPISVAI